MAFLDELRVAHAELRYGLADLKAELKFRRFVRSVKANFDPDQPRDDKGRWEDAGGGEEQTSAGSVQAVLADEIGFQLVGARVTQNNALTGISNIDEITERLSNTLINVMDTMQVISTRSGAAYGVAVHVGFAASVRSQDIPGIGSAGVEQSFKAGDVVKYGVEGSIRTDVTLRGANREVMAIYDVKTGDAVLRPSRAQELRDHTKAAPGTPVIELHFQRGPSLKHGQVSEDSWIYSASLPSHGFVRRPSALRRNGLRCQRIVA